MSNLTTNKDEVVDPTDYYTYPKKLIKSSGLIVDKNPRSHTEDWFTYNQLMPFSE